MTASWQHRARVLADEAGLLDVRLEQLVFGFDWDPPLAGANRSALHRLFVVFAAGPTAAWLDGGRRQVLKAGSCHLVPAGLDLAFRFTPGLRMFACQFSLPRLPVERPFAAGHQQRATPPALERSLIAALASDEATAIVTLHGICRLLIAPWLRPDLLVEASELKRRFAALYTVLDQADARTRVATCAAALGLSPNACSQAFRRATGRSLQQAIHERVAQRCCRALLADDRPLRVIADELGFSDAFHLSRFVKRQTGLSPRDYRRLWAS